MTTTDTPVHVPDDPDGIVLQDNPHPTAEDFDVLRNELANVQARLGQLRDELAMTRTARDEWSTRAADLTTRLEEQHVEGLEWIEKLLDTAHEAADRHNLCGVYDEVMGELGLPGRWVTFNVAVQASFDLTVTHRARLNEVEDISDMTERLQHDREQITQTIMAQVRRGDFDWEVTEYEIDSD